MENSIRNSMDRITEKITGELKIRREQTLAAVRLIDEGNTIPFIARYRKEATGGLNDEQLRSLSEKLLYFRGLEEKKDQVLQSIGEQGKLTQELRKKIEDALTMVEVEDLYLPYRPKRKTRASSAREKSLQGLAEFLRKGGRISLEQEVLRYVFPEGMNEKGEPRAASAEEALQGAMDILAEELAEQAEVRTMVRECILRKGSLTTAAKEAGKASGEDGRQNRAAGRNGKENDRRSVYEIYSDFEERLADIPGHRILAVNRGEKEKYLTVRIQAPEEEILKRLKRHMTAGKGQEIPAEECRGILEKTAEDSYKRLIAPAMEREIRNALTEKAEEGAIDVFRENLRQLLMQPPIAGQVVLGWDPAFRTGCKLAVTDETGRVLDTAVIYPTAPQNKVKEAEGVVRGLIDRYGITLISLGNGTASRESEQIITEMLRKFREQASSTADRERYGGIRYVIVNEAGASVYSASALATEEFPQFDVGQRSAASMARRLQDPLAELVKIDPKSIGVGQYQHDMDQKKLDRALHGVVEDCVNRVGVDLNTASCSLLSYISGISMTVARNITEYREQNGRFRNRRELRNVPKLGPKAFEQCAGFLRIRDGDEPLDSTAVHPENYGAVRRLLKELQLEDDRTSFAAAGSMIGDLGQTAEHLGIGSVTLRDILEELEKPGRDPRENMPAPVLREDVLNMEDLAPGMKLKGTVRNIVDFGAFVDIGVHQDGLVHISRITDRFIRHPLEAVHVGDVVDVTVVSVDIPRKRIALTMNGKM